MSVFFYEKGAILEVEVWLGFDILDTISAQTLLHQILRAIFGKKVLQQWQTLFHGLSINTSLGFSRVSGMAELVLVLTFY